MVVRMASTILSSSPPTIASRIRLLPIGELHAGTDRSEAACFVIIRMPRQCFSGIVAAGIPYEQFERRLYQDVKNSDGVFTSIILCSGAILVAWVLKKRRNASDLHFPHEMQRLAPP